MKKRILSLVLAALMVVSMLPVTALAAEGSPEQELPVEELLVEEVPGEEAPAEDTQLPEEAQNEQTPEESPIVDEPVEVALTDGAPLMALTLEDHDLEVKRGTDYAYEGEDYEWDSYETDKLLIMKSGLTVSGSTTKEYVEVAGDVSDLTIDGLSITEIDSNAITFLGDGDLILKGDNILTGDIDGVHFGNDGVISGSGKVTVKSTEGEAVLFNDEVGKLLLEGTGSPITLTAGDGKKAVYNAETEESPVAGDKFDTYYIASGAPDTQSVTYSIQKSIDGATVGSFAEMTYNGEAQTPSATVTIDGLTVTGSWSNVTNVGETTTFTANGQFTGTITDQDPGMKKASLTVTAKDKAITYGEAAANDGVEYSGFKGTDTADVLVGTLTYTYMSRGDEPAAYAPGSPVGDYDIIPGGLTAENYTINYINGTLTVNKAKIDKPTEAVDPFIYNGREQTYTPEGFDADTMDISGNKQTNANTTGYTVTVTPKDGYAWSTDGDCTFNWRIEKASPTVDLFRFEAPDDLTYDGQTKEAEITFNSSSGLTGMGQLKLLYQKQTGEDSWGEATEAAPTDAGTYKVSVDVEEGTNYAAASGLTSYNWIFTTTPKSITGATVGSFAELTYNGAARTPAAEVTVDGLTATGSWSDVTNVGDTTTFTASGNFTGTITDQDPGMKKAKLTVTAKDKAIAYGEAAANDGAEISGFVGDDTEAVLGGTLTYNYMSRDETPAAYEPGSPVGDYDIIPAGLTADNYTINYVSGTLTVNKAAYTVTFDKNGGDTEAAPNTIGEFNGEKYVLPTTDPTRTGYTFTGWYTAKDGGTEVTAETTVSLTAAQTLYAHWTANTYYIVFDANGGEGKTVGNRWYYYGKEYTLPIANNSTTDHDMHRYGYTFAGWALSADGEVVYGDQAAVSNLTAENGKTVTLYAVWTPTKSRYEVVVYKQKLDKSGYDFVMRSSEMGTTEAEITINPPSTLTGFKKPDPKKVTITAKPTVVVEFYYDRLSYELTWNLAGGSASGSYTSGETLYEQPITAPVPTKDGYTFARWNKTVPEVMPAGDQTFTALWTANTYNVTLNAGEGASCAALTSYTYGVGATLPIPTKTGYEFAGWFDNDEFKGMAITEITATDMGAKTFYAKWTPGAASYNVHYYLQKLDGTYEFKMGSASGGTTDSKVTVIPLQTFTGFKTPDPQEITISGDSTTTVNFYYERLKYKLTWDLDSGSASGDFTPTGETLFETPLVAPVPTKDGYTFAGWDKEVPATMPAEDQTFVSLWMENLTGTVSITGEAKYGETLTALADTNNTGTLSYQWERDGEPITGATGSTYELTADDIGKSITVTVTSDKETGSLTSEPTEKVAKADAPAAPEGLAGVACTTADNNDGKITGTTPAMEYSTSADFTDAKTCTGTEITGLTPGTYYVRVAETATTEAGAAATVTIEAYEPEAVDYKIIAGAKAVWTKGSKDGQLFTSNAPFAKFESVKVDGAIVDAKNYTAKEGSTDVTFTASYMETLSVGNHTLEIVSSDGSASTTFTVKSAVSPVSTTYTVTFNMNGHGTQITAQTVESGSKAIKPADPTASGYTFDGWYADETCATKFDFSSAITANTTVYAKWTKNSVTPTDPTTPKTGDNSNMFLWIALLFVSGGAFVGTTAYDKKRKRAE